MKCTKWISTGTLLSVEEAKTVCLNDSSCGGVYDVDCNEDEIILLCTANTMYWTNDTQGCIYQKVKGKT